MSHVAAKTIKFKAMLETEYGKIELPCAYVQFVHSIDDLPYVVVTAQLKNAVTTNVGLDLSTFVKLSADTQTYLVNKFRLYVDFSVGVQDGDGNEIAFSGFMTNPTFTVRDANLSLRYTSVHPMLGMQGFNANIYDDTVSYGYTDTMAVSNGQPVQDIDASYNLGFLYDPDSIADRINSLIISLGKRYDVKAKLNKVQQESLIPLHNINKVAYANYIKPMLTSERSLKGTVIPYSGLFSNVSATSSERAIGGMQSNLINGNILRSLFSNENFLTVLQDICAMFKFQLNANWKGEAWIEVIRTHQETEGRFILAPLESIEFNVASSYELPLLKTLVCIPEGGGYMTQSITPSGSPVYAVESVGQSAAIIRELEKNLLGEGALNSGNFVAYPDIVPNPNDLGTYMIIDPPNWVIKDTTDQSMLFDPTDDSDLLPSAGALGIEIRKKITSKTIVERANILRWIAKREFEEHFLRAASASVTLPFCASIQVGLTYDVKSADTGTTLFSGYLASCQHNISQGEAGAIANTRLIFTHVKASGTKFSRMQSKSVTTIPDVVIPSIGIEPNPLVSPAIKSPAELAAETAALTA